MLLGPALSSLRLAVEHAQRHDLRIQVLAVLDRGDALTREILSDADDATLIETDFGDPALARNTGVTHSEGDHIAFLDGDDLWSYNWLADAVAFARRQGKPTVCHSAANVVFGSCGQVWWHADSEDPYFDPAYLRVANYWDAMCLARRDLLAAHPFCANDLRSGYGHEDWHWKCETLCEGIAHRPVPGTVHFKRRRKGSQMTLCEDSDVVVRATAISRFSHHFLEKNSPLQRPEVEQSESVAQV